VAPAKRIAVASQGGGSHAAFTAGVLKVLLRQSNERDYRLMAFSGTSGGAISSLLAWYGLLTDGPEKAISLLDRFWRDNAARLPFETLWNGLAVWASGLPLEVRASPYQPPLSWMLAQLRLLSDLQERFTLWGPRREFVDLKLLLEKHVDFDTVKGHTGDPWFLVGAVDISSGRFKAFDSTKGEIGVEALLASAALPWLFRAVQVDGRAYWDGLFSQNPPIRDFITGRALDNRPDEIWIIQINPQERPGEPHLAEDILDRRNELSGNLSLNQEVEFIETVNRWLADGFLSADRFKTIHLHTIPMSPELAFSLNSASKLDRNAALLETLMADGEEQARRFLTTWSGAGDKT
jgi:NTE family protein